MSNYFENAKRMIGNTAETAITGLFCSAFVLFPGKSQVSQPEIKHQGDGFKGVTPLEDGVLFFHPGITANTTLDGSLAVVKDFSKGRNHDGRAEVKIVGGDSIDFNRPGVPKPVGTKGARGMYTQKGLNELTSTDLNILKGL